MVSSQWMLRTLKKKLGKKRYLQCLCSSSVQTKHVHMHIKHIWIPSLSSTCSFFVVSNYLAINSLFLCCHSSRMARFQFCLGLGVTAMMNTLHTHTKKTNLHNLLPQHLCKHTREIWRRLGQSLWYSCHWKPGIPRLWAASPEKNMCVIVMLPCRVICSFSISAVGCAFPTSQRWKKTSVTFFSCSDCQETVKSRD